MTPEEQKAADDKRTADEKKAASDKTAAEQKEIRAKQAGSVEGARSVAEAVRRVTDAAVAAIQKVEPTDTDLEFQAAGTAGGRFELNGPHGIFTASGTVKLNGVQLHTREWSSMRIVGDLPRDAKSGEIIVHIDDKTQRKGRLTL